MESWLHDGTFTNLGISNSTFVAPWLGLDLYDLFNESILYCKAFEKVVLNNVAREQLKAKYGGSCHSTVTQLRSESRKCINCTFYDQLEFRLLGLISADLINVYKT